MGRGDPFVDVVVVKRIGLALDVTQLRRRSLNLRRPVSVRLVGFDSVPQHPVRAGHPVVDVDPVASQDIALDQPTADRILVFLDLCVDRGELRVRHFLDRRQHTLVACDVRLKRLHALEHAVAH